MYVTLCISRGSQCILSWRMFEVQFDWTFAKLLEVTVASIDTPEQLPDTDVVCELSREMNSPPVDRYL